MTSVQTAAPFATALRYATAPYARGTTTQTLTLGVAVAGVSAIADYDFATFQSLYGLQSADLVASYVLTLKADQFDGPAVVDIGWVGRSGGGTSRIVVPAGSLAGESFGVPDLPSDPSLVLRSLSEQPPPTGSAPSGPSKWDLTVLLGNGARTPLDPYRRGANACGRGPRRAGPASDRYCSWRQPGSDRRWNWRLTAARRALSARLRPGHCRALPPRRRRHAGRGRSPRLSRRQRRRSARRGR